MVEGKPPLPEQHLWWVTAPLKHRMAARGTAAVLPKWMQWRSTLPGPATIAAAVAAAATAVANSLGRGRAAEHWPARLPAAAAAAAAAAAPAAAAA
eukprot:CAMPEP_0171193040 /NCGR_PEP_ID=MMETSP0790-20130122/20174_1 /TAXON_ID=2925 /ORGANISM="Alexandrium catenella, Strain OF101" /LENGTH=95 /DNA_ID=CAMNT_0011658205 /DNA_START=21 /DNA_END=305 /DNA_ORIENTATION=-